MPASASLLRMRRPDLSGLPSLDTVPLPPGYALRTFRLGDKEPWCELMTETMAPQWNLEHAEKHFFGTPEFDPENVFFVTWQGVPIGTASAWPEAPEEPHVGRVHMVGVSARHRGLRLGCLLTLRVLHRIRELGYAEAVLNTQDHRLAAVKVYLRLGFEPLHVVPEHAGRWEKVLDALRHPPNSQSK